MERSGGGGVRRPRVEPRRTKATSLNEGASCYIACMTTKTLRDVLQRVESCSEAAQAELAEIALQIDATLTAGTYHATPQELEGIDRGLKAAREGSFATDEQVEQVFRKYRPA